MDERTKEMLVTSTAPRSVANDVRHRRRIAKDARRAYAEQATARMLKRDAPRAEVLPFDMARGGES